MSNQPGIYLNYQILRVVNEKFATYDSVILDNAYFSLSGDVKFQVDVKNHSVRTTFEFGIQANGSEFIELTTSVDFLINYESWEQLSKPDGSREIPLSFALHMGREAISTSRGILHAKTEGTHFNRFVIPDLNVEDFVTGGLVIT